MLSIWPLNLNLNLFIKHNSKLLFTNVLSKINKSQVKQQNIDKYILNHKPDQIKMNSNFILKWIEWEQF